MVLLECMMKNNQVFVLLERVSLLMEDVCVVCVQVALKMGSWTGLQPQTASWIHDLRRLSMKLK